MICGRERMQRRVFALSCVALAGFWLWWGYFGPEFHPQRAANMELGLWAMRLLMATMVISPLSRVLRQPALKRWRRPLGLAAFGFTVVHTLHYLDYTDVWPNDFKRLFDRTYLFIGTVALLVMTPLALTSANAAVRRMGPKAWRTLHGGVYVVGPLSVLHDLMAYGEILGEAGFYCLLCPVLLFERVMRSQPRVRVVPAAAPPIKAEADRVRQAA